MPQQASRATFLLIATATLATLATSAASAAVAVASPVAVYQFANSFASSVAGAPDLLPVDPLLRASFSTDTVNGVATTVYSFGGTRFPTTDQGGLALDVSGLLVGGFDHYSVEIVFRLTENGNAWRRILDVEDRQSDQGFYVDPNNRLNIYPVSSGNAFTTDAWHHVFLVNDRGTATYYLDNGAATVSTTSVMDVSASGRMHFFLDNVAGGGQGEYSSGSVALIRLYDTALAAPPPPIPEPGTWALLAAGLGLLAARARREASAR